MQEINEMPASRLSDATTHRLRKEEAPVSDPAQSPLLPKLELLLAIHSVAAIAIGLVLGLSTTA